MFVGTKLKIAKFNTNNLYSNLNLLLAIDWFIRVGSPVIHVFMMYRSYKKLGLE